MAQEHIAEPHYDADWHRGYHAGLETLGDIPQFMPGGLSAFNMGYIAGMKAARSTSGGDRPKSGQVDKSGKLT
jgi:hypothetical protein